jgi:predicted outer membrane protein
MRFSRHSAGAVLVTGALVVTIASLVYPVVKGFQASATSPDVQTESTRYGPLTNDDRDFVVKVRLAGLWEFPAGQLSLRKGTTEAFKTAGRHLMDGHAALDATCREIAQQLGITLPNRATPQQRGFVATLAASRGEEFDRNLATILRIAHGQIFSSIADIRATTKNSLVRRLADQANDTVLDHMTVLEATGFVDENQMAPQITASPTDNPASTVPPYPAPGERQRVIRSSPGASAPATSAPPDSIGTPVTAVHR